MMGGELELEYINHYQRIFRKREISIAARGLSYGELTKQYKLIQEKKCKLPAMVRKEIVARYEEIFPKEGKG